MELKLISAHFGQLTLLSPERDRPEETLSQFQSNLFGPLNVYRAILPHMRGRHAGILATVGSMGSLVPDGRLQRFQGGHAHGRHRPAGRDRRGFGIKHFLIEPGLFPHRAAEAPRRIWPRRGKRVAAGRLRAAERDDGRETLRISTARSWEDPVKGVEIIYDVLNGTGVAKGKPVPRCRRGDCKVGPGDYRSDQRVGDHC